jgi:ornithine cyclodeaminase
MHNHEPLIWLTEKEVAELLSPADAYAAVRDALVCHARGDYQQPLKPYVRPGGREGEYTGGRFIAMPAYLGGRFQMAGLKWIAGFQANVARGLPRASGALVLNSIATGQLLAIMECATLSARRTAAVAALAVDELAPPGPLRLAVLGAGPIARSVLEALAAVPRPQLQEVRLCDLRQERADQVAHHLRDHPLPPVQTYTSAQACVAGANVVICATAGSSNYLQKNWLSPGWLLVALSLDDATPELFLSADRVIVDDFDQCCREEKMLHRLVQQGRFSRGAVAAEFGEVIAGCQPGRRSAAENVYLNPMGMAIEDVAVGVTVYRKARTQGAGLVLKP